MTVTQQKLFYDERTNVDDNAAASQAAPDLHLNNNDFNPWNIKEFPTLLSVLNTLTSSVTGPHLYQCDGGITGTMMFWMMMFGLEIIMSRAG